MTLYNEKRQQTSWFRSFSGDVNRPEIARAQFRHGMQGIGVWHYIRCLLLVAENNELPLDFDLITYQCREKDTDLIKSVICDFGLFSIDEKRGIFYDPDVKAASDCLAKAREDGRRGGKNRGNKSDPPNGEPQKEETSTLEGSNANTLEGSNANTLEGSDANTLEGADVVPLQPIEGVEGVDIEDRFTRGIRGEEIEDPPPSFSSENLDFSAIVSEWNGLGLPKVNRITAEIRKNITGRHKDLTEMGMTFSEFFEKISKSEFLTGRTKDPFTASLSWILTSKNFEKILNGEYDTTPRRNVPGKPSVYLDSKRDYGDFWETGKGSAKR